MEKRKTYEVESMDDLRQMIEELPDGVILEVSVKQGGDEDEFSVGNADRIFEPYRAKENLSRENTAALLKHLLVFYNVGDRSWAISQNLLIISKRRTHY